MNEDIEHYRKNVDKSLIMRQRIFIVIILVLMGISVFNVIQGKITSVLALSGFLLATILGLVLSRMFRIFWHEEKKKVTSQLDALGIALLLAYIAIEVGRTWIFKHWLDGAALSAFGLVIVMGLLLGRFIGTVLRIKEVLSTDTDKKGNSL